MKNSYKISLIILTIFFILIYQEHKINIIENESNKIIQYIIENNNKDYSVIDFSKKLMIYQLRNLESDDQIIDMKKKWFDNQWGIQIVSSDILCENDFKWLTTKMSEDKAKLFCRIDE